MKRFWSKVDKSPGLGPNGDCWEWAASKNENGYGQFYYEGKPELAHRFAWCLTFGKWPEFHICHRCDNPACVNSNHLFEGTHKDNMEDMVKKGRQTKGEMNGVAILTENQILEIRASRERQRKLAEKFGVSQSNISLIKSQKRWSHLQ